MPTSAVPTRDVIITALNEVYRGPAWHGPAVLETLDGVTADVAARKTSAHRNSIWELVLHLTHGRHLLIDRVRNATEDFPREIREPWWPAAAVDTSQAAWRRDLDLLEEYHERLIAATRHASDAALARQPAPGDQPVGQQLLGMAIHDAYHAGQIRLLALMAADREARADQHDVADR
jgi:DinB family protein